MDYKGSPFLSLLGTNYSATDTEAAHIEDLLLEPTVRLYSLQKRIDELHQQHARLLRLVEDHRALTAPARRLPMEVMQEIFLRCLPKGHNAVMHVRESPLLLTQVCSRWRSISLRTPALWTSIHIPMPTGNSLKISREKYANQSVEVARRRARMITEWLGRSGTRPLDITLHNGNVGGRPLEAYRIIFDACLPFANRWGSLILDADTSTLAPIAALPPSSLPALHSITICGPHVLSVTNEFWRSSGIVRAPNLKNVSIGNITEDFTVIPLPLSNLTTLSLRGVYGVMLDHRITTGKLLAMLGACSNLRYCLLDISSLAGLKNTIHGEPENLVTVLPRLLHLVISIRSNQSEIRQLLNSLEAPALECLEIYGCEDYKIPVVFLRGTLYQLTTLAVDPRVFPTKEDFIFCMQDCPYLCEFELNFMDNNRPSWRTATYLPIPRVKNWMVKDEFLKVLTSPMQLDKTTISSLIIPRLSAFKCHVFNTFSDSSILSFIKARKSTLRLVRFQVMRSQEPFMDGELKRLSRQGIDIEMPAVPSVSVEKITFPAYEGIVGSSFYKTFKDK